MNNLSPKSAVRARYEQLMYWTSIAWDLACPAKSKGVYVLGYVKSGTNWLCNLLSGALNIPVLESWEYRYPRLGPSIFHMHRILPIESARRRTVYIMRDGRDTVVSYFYQFIREDGTDKKKFEEYLGSRVDFENMRQCLPEFISYTQMISKATADYRTHLSAWQQNRDSYITVRYEDLLADTAGELSRLYLMLTGGAAHPEIISRVVADNNFARVSGRQSGVEDKQAFNRKGIQGDWKNHFSRKAAIAYDQYAGELLMELGYENDPQWASKIP